jgi:hypothetical protein
MAKTYEFVATSDAGKKYQVVAVEDPTSTTTFEGTSPIENYRWQLKDGTPVKKIADMWYELPDGTIIKTKDGNAP